MTATAPAGAPPFNPRTVEALAAALPPEGDNPVGRAARDMIAIHIKRCTPGHYSQLIGTGPAFRDIFFSGVGPNAHEAQVPALTGLDDGFFAQFAVAMLCQQMWNATTRLRPQLQADQIAAELAGMNARLRDAAYRFYAYMAGVADSPIAAALAQFPDGQSRALARQHYLAGVTSESWVNDKRIQDSSHNWPDRDWELLHHWIKLIALGASREEVDGAIRAAMALGLPVPPELGPGVWQARTPWLGGDIGGGDAADATQAMVATRCHAVPGSRYPSCMDEDNSFEFTARSQPGNRYRRPPSSSCLAPGTLVVMADGALRPIERIAPGDAVATPSGSKRVVVRPAPLRAGRILRRFTGTGIAFASSHPFLVHAGPGGADPGPRYAAADPAALARAVPTLAQFGIAGLDGPRGPALVRRTPDGDMPYQPPPVADDPDRRPDLLYDLYLEVGPDGRSEYYAGDEQVQLLVSSEAPRFAEVPQTAAVILHVLERAGPAILAALADVPDDSFDDLLCVGLESLARTMLPAIGPRLSAAGRGSGPGDGPGPAGARLPESAEELAGAVRRFAASLGGGAPGYDRRTGALIERFAALFADQFQAVLTLPWRAFHLAAPDLASVAAVTVYSVHLFHPGPAAADAAVEVTLARGPARCTRSLPVQPSAAADRWYYAVDRLAYFPEWAPPDRHARRWLSSGPHLPGPGGPPARHGEAGDGLLWTLEIRLAPDAGAMAALPLPAEISHGFGAFRAPLLGSDGAIAGWAQLDVRLLTTEVFARELRDGQAGAARAGDLPGRLAALAAGYTVRHFARAVSEFRFCAATTTLPQAG